MAQKGASGGPTKAEFYRRKTLPQMWRSGWRNADFLRNQGPNRTPGRQEKDLELVRQKYDGADRRRYLGFSVDPRGSATTPRPPRDPLDAKGVAAS